MLSSQCDIAPNHIINFKCSDKATYTQGAPLSLQFVKIVTRKGWSIEEIGIFILRYINLLGLIAAKKNHLIVTSRPSDRLPGNFFDMVPQNIIIDHDGQPVAIDTEWALNGDIELGLLLFRSLLLAMGSGVGFRENSRGRSYSRQEFIKTALDIAGYALEDEELVRFIALESVIQEKVSGYASQVSLNCWLEQPLPIYGQSEPGNDQTHALVKYDEQLAGQQTILEYHNRITMLEGQIENTMLPFRGG